MALGFGVMFQKSRRGVLGELAPQRLVGTRMNYLIFSDSQVLGALCSSFQRRSDLTPIPDSPDPGHSTLLNVAVEHLGLTISRSGSRNARQTRRLTSFWIVSVLFVFQCVVGSFPVRLKSTVSFRDARSCLSPQLQDDVSRSSAIYSSCKLPVLSASGPLYFRSGCL
ncbi:hypothetical protein DFH07DRAFT_354901 [Mycena maculata]|uniref:Uncharacterized protein n=1 Tax=Mycena maculata TaxID=230809 RepID=A0AAD7HAN4_9AGAR|nr:hypothetical protein DFH07DRAFT_354901 [Mycena maculata]